MPQAFKYIRQSLGPEYAEGVLLDLQEMVEESTVRTPMVCLLSLGSDPTNAIEALAKKEEIGKVVAVCVCSLMCAL